VFAPLNFPPIDARIEASADGQFQVFDICRKRMVLLTPEEWVRQHALHYLHLGLAYPLSLMAVEKQLKLNTTLKRTDIVAYNAQMQAMMIVECKAPGIKLNQNTLDQALRYNIALQVPFLLMTNGLQHACLQVRDGVPEVYRGIPSYEQIVGRNF